MWEIYRTLAKYKLEDISSLQANLSNMSDSQLLKLSEDIACSSEQDTTQEVESSDRNVSFCPIGGDLSLGNFEEISKQLLLYADNIVLEEPLTNTAKFALENKKLSPSREEFLQRLHPLIRQLLLIQPAVEANILNFVHSSTYFSEKPSELADKIVHPQLNRIRRRLLDKVECRQQSNRALSFIFGKGSNQFISIGGSIFTKPHYFVRGEYPSKEKESSLGFGEWKFEPQGVQVPSKLIENDSRAREALDKAVNQVITRVVLGLHTAEKNKSNYMTDDSNEWEIIKLLSRIEGEEKDRDIAKHVFAMQLAKELSFLENIAVKDLLDLRFSYNNEFQAFRNGAASLFQNIQGIDLNDWDKLHSIAKKTVTEKVYPAIFDIRRILQSLNRQKRLDTSVKIGIGLLSLASYIYSPESQTSPWVGYPPIPQFEVRRLERGQKAEEARKRPMYFLWEVMKEAGG